MRRRTASRACGRRRRETSFRCPLLQPYRDKCVFFRGLSMGADRQRQPSRRREEAAHRDRRRQRHLDRSAARVDGRRGDPFRLLYLGAQANVNNASGDKHISYVAPGFTTPPDDDPVAAFTRVFGASGTTTGGGGGGGGSGDRTLGAPAVACSTTRRPSSTALEDEARRHREDEARPAPRGGARGRDADPGARRRRWWRWRRRRARQPSIDATGLDASTLYAPERFPQILRAQIDLMVQAMACGLTRVGVIQASHHTSELIMSRFMNTQMYDPGFDMRSHQASHYGASHDPSHREYKAFAQQVRWWVEQFAYSARAARGASRGQGTMLDHSLVLLCSEIADGNTHLHDDMPFVLAGGGGGTIRTGRLLDVGYRRHGDLLVAIANAMGDGIGNFGDASSGPLPGLLDLTAYCWAMEFGWPEFSTQQPLDGGRRGRRRSRVANQHRDDVYYLVTMFDADRPVGELTACLSTPLVVDDWTRPEFTEDLRKQIAGVAATGKTNTEYVGATRNL